MLCMEDLEQRLEGQFKSDNPFHTEDKSNLSPVQLPDFAAFVTSSLPRPVGQGLFKMGEAVMQRLPPG